MMIVGFHTYAVSLASAGLKRCGSLGDSRLLKSKHIFLVMREEIRYETKTSFVHYSGIWHKVVQCWIVCRTEAGIRVYLQRRSFEKQSHPGRYDITAAGHVGAGEEPLDAILREASEEIGIRLNRQKIHELGYIKEAVGTDREIAYLYCLLYTSPSPRDTT